MELRADKARTSSSDCFSSRKASLLRLTVADGLGYSVNSLGCEDIIFIGYHSLLPVLYNSESKKNRAYIKSKQKREKTNWNQ